MAPSLNPKDRVGEPRAFSAASPQRLSGRDQLGWSFVLTWIKGHFVTQVACCEGNRLSRLGPGAPFTAATLSGRRICVHALATRFHIAHSPVNLIVQAVKVPGSSEGDNAPEKSVAVQWALTGSQPPSRASEEDAALRDEETGQERARRENGACVGACVMGDGAVWAHRSTMALRGDGDTSHFPYPIVLTCVYVCTSQNIYIFIYVSIFLIKYVFIYVY